MNKTPTRLIAAKRIAVAVATVCATLAAPAYATDDVKNVLDLMLKKGVISQQDYDQFMKDNADAAENKQFKEQRLDKDVAKSNSFILKREKDGSVKPTGFGFISADGQNEINLTGRLHYDARFFDTPFTEGFEDFTGAAKSGNQFDARRARIGVNGKFMKDFSFEMVWNAASSDSSNIDTGWVNYGAVKEFQARVGRFKQPFNLEEYGTSSNNIDFIERSYVNQIGPGKKMGAMLHGVPKDGIVYAVSTWQNTNSVISGSGNIETGARLAADFAKIAGINDQVMHLGYAGSSGTQDVAASSSLATIVSIRSEHRGVEAYKSTFASTTTAATTGQSYIDKKLSGVELAYAFGPFKLQSEYATARYSATNNTSANSSEGNGDLKTKYIAAVYNLTGEKWSDSYKDGGFGSIKPNSNFDAKGSGIGAWQVGVRMSSYDARSLTGTETGSERGKTTTIGLTWFINPNARILLNHSITKFDTALTTGFLGYVTNGTTALGDTERVTTIRGQWNF
jgi:phosphate-selective porin OprO/OprP